MVALSGILFLQGSPPSKYKDPLLNHSSYKAFGTFSIVGQKTDSVGGGGGGGGGTDAPNRLFMKGIGLSFLFFFLLFFSSLHWIYSV